MKLIIIAIAIVCSVVAAHADCLGDFISLPKMELGIVQGVTPEYSTGVSMSYPVLKIANEKNIFVDIAALKDDAADVTGFLGGFSTDANIPIISSINIETRVGVGFTTQSDSWLFYLRVPVF